jgi:hypothetical protein
VLVGVEGIAIVASKKLKGGSIGNPSASEIDTFVGPRPLELAVDRADEFLVGTTSARPDLEEEEVNFLAVVLK